MTVLTVKLVNGRELSRDTAGPVDAVHCHSLCGVVQRHNVLILRQTVASQCLLVLPENLDIGMFIFQ